MGADKKVQEMTGREIARENAKVLGLIETERKKQAIAAALWIASGRIDRVDWPVVGSAYRDEARWKWQHAISPTKEMRYSITFRTLRA